MTQLETVAVTLGERSYDIVVGDTALARAGEFMAPVLKQKRVVVITDENVAKLHLETLLHSLDHAAITHEVVILPPGEASKSFAQIEALLDDLLGRGIERGTTLVALGGGVIGDITGFAAAIALRGLDFVQIPTTLLAQVDSSVGGKTGINTTHGKNLVGAFHQPRLVLADTSVLNTLTERELLAGYAEIVKYGLISDPDFFVWLERHGAAIRDGDPAARRHAVVHSCRIKAAVVAADEREAGQRALLNLGHTFGHALEAEAGYGDILLHGEAVAIGMVMAFDLSVLLGLCPVADAAKVQRHLASLGMHTGLDAVPTIAWDPDRLIGHMAKDKKVQGGRMTLVLVRGIGKAFLSREVGRDQLLSLLEGAIAT